MQCRLRLAYSSNSTCGLDLPVNMASASVSCSPVSSGCDAWRRGRLRLCSFQPPKPPAASATHCRCRLRRFVPSPSAASLTCRRCVFPYASTMFFPPLLPPPVGLRTFRQCYCRTIYFRNRCPHPLPKVLIYVYSSIIFHSSTPLSPPSIVFPRCDGLLYASPRVS